MTSALATPAEVADYLRTSVESLTMMRYRGTGPRFTRRGRRVLYRWSDVYEYVEGNLRESSRSGS